jgi:hypothetical protein
MSSAPSTTQRPARRDYAVIDQGDRVDVTSYDSFPASDPPSWIETGIGSPHADVSREALIKQCRKSTGGSQMISIRQKPVARRAPFFRSAIMLHPLVAHEDHSALREGAKLGIIVAIATWLWITLIDAVAGDPFHTATTLGGVVGFTLAHCALNVAYGFSLVSLIHGAARHPSLILVALIGFAMIEIGFIMLTAALSYFLGGIAWLSIFGGSVIGAAIAFLLLIKAHPLKALLHEAETER